ncbi:MAG: type II secretion system F family protein [Firmicutes bacterium]|nr:type II secretion system F family protein [Bacillota bacterium]
MSIAVMCLATALIIIWLSLLGMTKREDWSIAAYNKVFDNLAAIEKLRLKDVLNHKKLTQYSGVAAKIMNFFLGKSSDKKIETLEYNIAQLQNGSLSGINPFIMPGYVLQRKYKAIGISSFTKKVLSINNELYGRKHAVNKTKQLLAKILSYTVIGVGVVFALGAFFMGLDYMSFGIALTIIGPAIMLTFAYSLYDEIKKKAERRYEAIGKQFPNVVSKLALLVTSGMIMDRAWKETALSQNLDLYLEMRKTAQELDNLVSPAVAFTNFIKRCNTKETTKLAAAIMQNLSKGNAEIGQLLQVLAREAWLERRHRAKRDSEKANSKLLIPIMLLFTAILIMIMVPVAMNFTVF